jgi:hypothetical protein
MSKKEKSVKINVHSTERDVTEEIASTVVNLVDENGKPCGRASLVTKPGVNLHYRFENTIKLMIK